MFGVRGTGDTSGYGGLTKPVQMPGPSAPPYGGWMDDVATALAELRATHEADHKAAFQTKLDEAVKAGTLTQAEADAVVKAADTGVIGYGGRR